MDGRRPPSAAPSRVIDRNSGETANQFVCSAHHAHASRIQGKPTAPTTRTATRPLPRPAETPQSDHPRAPRARQRHSNRTREQGFAGDEGHTYKPSNDPKKNL